MSELNRPGITEFQASVEKKRKEYEKLSDAKLAKKIRHLTRAANRCSVGRNVVLMLAFQGAAIDILRQRHALRGAARD